MSMETQSESIEPLPPTEPIAAKLLRVAWLSVLLGLVIEILLLAASAALSHIPAMGSVLADTVQKLSWSTIVCVGLAVGTTASKHNPPVAGLAGLFAGVRILYLGFLVELLSRRSLRPIC